MGRFSFSSLFGIYVLTVKGIKNEVLKKSCLHRGEKEEGLLLKIFLIHLYRIPRIEMKRKEASDESFLHVGWHVAMLSVGKQN